MSKYQYLNVTTCPTLTHPFLTAPDSSVSFVSGSVISNTSTSEVVVKAQDSLMGPGITLTPGDLVTVDSSSTTVTPVTPVNSVDPSVSTDVTPVSSVVPVSTEVSPVVSPVSKSTKSTKGPRPLLVLCTHIPLIYPLSAVKRHNGTNGTVLINTLRNVYTSSLRPG